MKLSGAIGIVSVLGVLVVLGIWGWQIFTYLEVGTWPSLSVIDLMHKYQIAWAYAPDSWFGVHKILAACPLAVALIGVVGLLILAANVAASVETEKRLKTERFLRQLAAERDNVDRP